MMVATFNGNSSITIVSCYSPTNASDETDFIILYNELSSLDRSIPKHNVLIIGGDMNSQIGKDKNNKYCLHNSSNRNGEHLAELSLENRLTYLNTKFQKRIGNLWTYTSANDAKTQIDYILINKKWINNASELWGIFLFLRSIFRSQNYHRKDTSEPTQEYDINSQNHAL